MGHSPIDQETNAPAGGRGGGKGGAKGGAPKQPSAPTPYLGTQRDRTDVTLVMNSDGTLSGLLNPGLKSAKMQKAALDASNWGVHFEAGLKDKSGATVHVVADGKIEDVTNVHRAIVGTWTQGSVKGDFNVIRDN